MTSIFEINDAFNNYLARKAKREGRIHNKYSKLIDDDLIEWGARAKAGLLGEAEKPAKLAVSESDSSLPISEKTGKHKLAVWCPIDRKVIGYVSESDEEPFVTLAKEKAETEEAVSIPLQGQSSDSEYLPIEECEKETPEQPSYPLD